MSQAPSDTVGTPKGAASQKLFSLFEYSSTASRMRAENGTEREGNPSSETRMRG